MKRIFGSYFAAKKIINHSPIYGYGLGSKNIEKTLESFGGTFSLEDIGNVDHLEPEYRELSLSLTNIITVLLYIGGIPLLFLFIYYVIKNFGFNKYLIIYIMISLFTGSIWNPIYFIVPSVSKYLRNKNK